jgi:hypothetical protein
MWSLVHSRYLINELIGLGMRHGTVEQSLPEPPGDLVRCGSICPMDGGRLRAELEAPSLSDP